VTAVLVFAATLAAPARADEKSELKKLQGNWAPVSLEMGAQKFPDERAKAIALTIAGNEYTVTVSGQADKGTLKLDPAAKPKAMDIVGTDGPNKGRTFPAIYELSGDTLTICYALEGKDRPTEFKTRPGTPLFLVIYKRAK
jgi:uncharacterized protein (TIGR03067 family)